MNPAYSHSPQKIIHSGWLWMKLLEMNWTLISRVNWLYEIIWKLFKTIMSLNYPQCKKKTKKKNMLPWSVSLENLQPHICKSRHFHQVAFFESPEELPKMVGQKFVMPGSLRVIIRALNFMDVLILAGMVKPSPLCCVKHHVSTP